MKLVEEKTLDLKVKLKVQTYNDDDNKSVNSYRVIVPIDTGFMVIESELIIPKDKKELKQYFEYLSKKSAK